MKVVHGIVQRACFSATLYFFVMMSWNCSPIFPPKVALSPQHVSCPCQNTTILRCSSRNIAVVFRAGVDKSTVRALSLLCASSTSARCMFVWTQLFVGGQVDSSGMGRVLWICLNSLPGEIYVT